MQYKLDCIGIESMHEIICIRGFRSVQTGPMWINSRECVCRFAVCLVAWRESLLLVLVRRALCGILSDETR
jgi:hypothetical protein